LLVTFTFRYFAEIWPTLIPVKITAQKELAHNARQRYFAELCPTLIPVKMTAQELEITAQELAHCQTSPSHVNEKLDVPVQWMPHT
jgi:hypothetical protein